MVGNDSDKFISHNRTTETKLSAESLCDLMNKLGGMRQGIITRGAINLLDELSEYDCEMLVRVKSLPADLVPGSLSSSPLHMKFAYQ